MVEGSPEPVVPLVQGEEELRRRLFWLAAARILVITLLLAGGSYFLLQTGQAYAERAVTALSGLVAAASLLQIAIALFLRAGWKLRPLAVAQVLGDLVFAIALLFFTGVSDSLFSFVLPLVVVSGGALLGVRGSLIAALASFFSYGLLLLLVQKGLLSPPGQVASIVPNRQAIQALFVHGSALFLTAGLIAYVLGQARRAGERAEAAESSLLHLNVLHDSIVRSIGSGILTTDRKGRITYANRAGEEILETSLPELQGLPLEEIFPSMLQGMDEAKTFRRETEWRTRSGTKRLLGFALTPLQDPAGFQLGTAAVFQDLTGLRELEGRAARSERLAAVGELAAGLAHELRNPLASISGATEMLSQEDRKDGKPLLRIVLRETERLNRLVSDFLAYATPAPPKTQAVDLVELVDSVLQAFALHPAANGVEVEASLADAHALADEDHLRQVLWNLLLNAAQASAPGGTIRLGCGPSPEAEGKVVLSVEDEGCGIPSNQLEKIFDPFFTTKEKGTGLGLPMVHRVVEALAGDLVVESREGEGTRFSITLPVAAAARSA